MWMVGCRFRLYSEGTVDGQILLAYSTVLLWMTLLLDEYLPHSCYKIQMMLIMWLH
jgi:hypothetical protein